MTRLRAYLSAVEIPDDSVIVAALRSILGADKLTPDCERGPLIAGPVDGRIPRAGSRVGPPCQRCGRRVWIGPETMTLGISYTATVCLDCLAREVARISP